MLATVPMYEQIEMEIMFEGFLSKLKAKMFKPQQKQKLEQLMDDPKVQEFMKLNEVLIDKGKLTFAQKKDMLALLQNKQVKLYTEEMEKSVKLAGQIGGGMLGGFMGALGGLVTAAGLGASSPVAAVIIGAAAMGYLGAKSISKLAVYLKAKDTRDVVRRRVSGLPQVHGSVTGHA